MIKVPYADWPESQIMLECKHSNPVGEKNAMVCLKIGTCHCLKHQKVLDEDRREDIEGEQEKLTKDDLPWPNSNELE